MGQQGRLLAERDFSWRFLVGDWLRQMVCIKEGRDLSVNPETAARRDFYENSITKPESLSAHLLTQLRMAFADDDRHYRGDQHRRCAKHTHHDAELKQNLPAA